jgi:peptidoglycan/xylan/chitin deacetylase (PgdA/CDA1 family)
MAGRGVPVVMYHSVGPPRTDWVWNYLITPIDVFEAQMRALADRGWTAISLKDLVDHMAKGTELPPKPVVLTFDDGYLDNWVYVYPIIRKFGHHAVIWMTTDFVDPSAKVRPNLEDVWSGRVGAEALDDHGYLSWEELRTMAADGAIEIQSHAMTHTWYPSGPGIIDFHRPGGVDGYTPPPWLAWNRFPDRKYASLTARLEDLIPYGTPIYENRKSLETRRYFEDPGLADRLADTVARGGGGAFFGREGWRGDLERVVADYGERSDRFETEAEYEERVRHELSGSKRLIEEAVGQDADFLCWPGGARNPLTMRIASEVGYRASTTHYEDPERRNTPGQNPAEINRIGCASPWIWRGKVIIRNTEPEFFIAALDMFAGSGKSLWTMRRHKLRYLLRYYLTGKT